MTLPARYVIRNSRADVLIARRWSQLVDSS